LEPKNGLSVRERQACELVALGVTNRQIGDVLHIGEDTVKKHVSRALARFDFHSRTNLAVALATGHVLDVTPPTRSR
jgi:DNA-binding NarL/FixJ family response regulator